MQKYNLEKRPWMRRSLAILAAVAAFATFAMADVFGRIKVIAKSAADAKPIAGATILLRDSAGAHSDVELQTDENGEVLSPPLENRPWEATITFSDGTTKSQTINVEADGIVNLEFLMGDAPAAAIAEKKNEVNDLLRKGQVALSTLRDLKFGLKFPSLGARNTINQLLGSVAGFVQNSAGQFSLRGQQVANNIIVNGFKLPAGLEGRLNKVLSMESISNLDVITGGLAPEFGGDAASILNVALKGGTINPFQRFNFGSGGFASFDGGITFGGQLGEPVGKADDKGKAAKQFAYFVDLSRDQSDNALEPPQGGKQDKGNFGRFNSAFGNFEYRPNQKDQFQLLINHNPSNAQIANRLGLPAEFASVGQGFGTFGRLSESEASQAGVMNQDAVGNRLNQQDVSSLGMLMWRRIWDPHTTSGLSFGIIHNGNETNNENDPININSLPLETSSEFSPFISRNARHFQVQGNLSHVKGRHNMKAGFLWENSNGRQSFQFIPNSQYALNWLYANYPYMAPPGRPVSNRDTDGTVDPLGNEFYVPLGGAMVPTLHLERSGYNRSAFLQDTYQATDALTINYGLRWDGFRQNLKGGGSIDDDMLAPRVNAVYNFGPNSLLRGAYNRLFTAPAMNATGAATAFIKPQKVDQFDLSFEHAMGKGQRLRASAYWKDGSNFLDTGMILPGTQVGATETKNIGDVNVKGFEFSYELVPATPNGFSANLTWTNSKSKRADGGDFLNGDQLNTINAGLNYAWLDGSQASFNFSYGSGLATADVFGDGNRRKRAQGNFRYVARPNLFGPGTSLQLDIENLFDSRTVLNFNGPFSSTRFQQGRRITLSVMGLVGP